jgi:C4-dicarboxylate transporter, DctM subunit
MTVLPHASRSSARPPLGDVITAALIIAIPIALALICVAARLHIIELSHTVRAELLFALLLALMTTGMPISIALGLSVLTYLFILSDVDPKMVGLKLFTSIDRFDIMAIPFFILAGNFLTTGGVARRMIDFATSLVGHWYGGLGLAGVVACALFAAISGSSVATVVGVGSIMLPALLQQGYPPRFGGGVITTSGALGILFPPSINLVIYAVATSGMQPRGPDGAVVDSASVGQLFIAALVPGLLLSAMLGATTWYRAWRNDYPRMQRSSWRDCWRAFRGSIWGLLLILLVLGGIYSGLFTPTEAAAVAAVYAFVIAVFVYRGLRFAEVPRVLLQAASMSAMILYIITNAAVFSWLLTSEQIPQSMAEWMTAQGFGTIGFLLITNVVLLAAGNFMDPAAIVLIMAPILFPMGAALGVNAVHLGILMAVNMEVGLCHPPVGLNLYVASGITGMGIGELTVAVLPWLATMLIFLVMVTYIPALSLWLPRLLGML